jgi:hypothetical protein
MHKKPESNRDRSHHPKSLMRTDGSHLWDPVAIVLLLSTPFVMFVTYHDYDYFAPEILCILGPLILVGLVLGAAVISLGTLFRVVLIALLLTLFIDIQFPGQIQVDPAYPSGWLGRLAVVFIVFAGMCWALRGHISQIVVSVFATIIVATLIFPPEKALPRTVSNESDIQADPNRPLIIHIVVDEQMGAEGTPTGIKGGPELKKDMKSFYHGAGFLHFGKAYSTYFDTQRSLGDLLNFDVEPTGTYTHDGTGIYRRQIKENALFDRLAGLGYQLRIINIDELGFCDGERPGVVSCHTNRLTSLKHLERLELPIGEKMLVVASFFLEPIVFFKSIRKAYRIARKTLAGIDIALPMWKWERYRLTPVAGIKALERLTGDLKAARPGEYYFAHILLPHFPYAYKSDCSLRMPSQWLDRYSQEGKSLRTDERISTVNTPETRHLRYQRYFDQIRCLNRKLGALFDTLRETGVYNDSVIIVHGDHGSRITLDDPGAGRKNPLPTADRVDSYSTLFAVKLPGNRPTYDLRLASIQSLFKDLADNNFLEIGPGPAPTKHPVGDAVGPDGQMIDFGEGSDFMP